jgi:hypothetical protein
VNCGLPCNEWRRLWKPIVTPKCPRIDW